MKEIKDGKALVDEGISSTASQDDSKKEVYLSEKPKNNVATLESKSKSIKNKGPQQTSTLSPKKNKNIPSMFVYLMVIVFDVLTMDIWLGIVKFLTGTIIIYKNLEESLQDHEIGSTMIFSEENTCQMGQTLNVLNDITMTIVLRVVDIRWNHLWTTLNASSVITMVTWLEIVGIRRPGKGNGYRKTKQITRFHKLCFQDL